MSDDETLERLSAEVTRDLKPVKPWHDATLQTLWLLPYGLLAAGILLVTFGLRRDASELGVLILWGLAAVQLVAAYGILALLVRESIPGLAVRPAVWLLALALVLAVQNGVAQLTYGQSPISVPLERVLPVGAACLGRLSLFALLPMLLGLALLFRGLPLRPRLSGLVAGLVGGLCAESIYRLHCPFSHWFHMLVWHSGAVLCMGVLGFSAGVVWEIRRGRAWRTRRHS